MRSTTTGQRPASQRLNHSAKVSSVETESASRSSSTRTNVRPPDGVLGEENPRTASTAPERRMASQAVLCRSLAINPGPQSAARQAAA